MNSCDGTAAAPLRLIAGEGPVRLICDFDLRGDRYGHRVGVRDADGAVTYLWESIEEGDDPAWPPSPPLQDLSIEEIDSCPTALAVGMAGRSHWSSSIQAVLSEKPALEFDFACKVPPGPAPLRSTYQRSEGSESSRADRIVSCDAGEVELSVVKGCTFSQLPPNGFCLNVDEPRDASQMRTIVWTYRVTLEPKA